MANQKVKQNNYRIEIYTTPGCEACRIMKNLVTKAIEDYSNITLTVESIGFSDKDVQKAKSLNIKDYPTTRMYREYGNKSLFELKGTYPKEYIQQVIDNCLSSN